MASNVLQLFNAINGIELKQMILKQVEEQLSKDRCFRQHLAYPIVEWQWQLKIKAYPGDQPEVELQHSQKIQQIDEQTKKAVEPSPSAKPIEIKRAGEVSVEGKDGIPADQAREQFGMPVKRTVIDKKTGLLVDAPPEVVKQSPGAGLPVFGRHVEVKK